MMRTFFPSIETAARFTIVLLVAGASTAAAQTSRPKAWLRPALHPAVRFLHIHSREKALLPYTGARIASVRQQNQLRNARNAFKPADARSESWLRTPYDTFRDPTADRYQLIVAKIEFDLNAMHFAVRFPGKSIPGLIGQRPARSRQKR